MAGMHDQPERGRRLLKIEHARLEHAGFESDVLRSSGGIGELWIESDALGGSSFDGFELQREEGAEWVWHWDALMMRVLARSNSLRRVQDRRVAVQRLWLFMAITLVAVLPLLWVGVR